MQTKRKISLSAAALRWLAIVFMLIDHSWMALIKPHWSFLVYLGRLAFPIFAFQIAEGCVHTSNFKRYALRLLLFGVISEIPFNLFIAANFVNKAHQNVMFTLLAGLLALRLLLWAKDKNFGRRLLAVAVFGVLYCLADLLALDYGGLGVALVVVFGLTRGLRWGKLVQVIFMVIFDLMIPARVLVYGAVKVQTQHFAILALALIWLYHGQKGKSGKLLQYSAYGFYPLHLGLLAVLRRIAVMF